MSPKEISGPPVENLKITESASVSADDGTSMPVEPALTTRPAADTVTAVNRFVPHTILQVRLEIHGTEEDLDRSKTGLAKNDQHPGIEESIVTPQHISTLNGAPDILESSAFEETQNAVAPDEDRDQHNEEPGGETSQSAEVVFQGDLSPRDSAGGENSDEETILEERVGLNGENDPDTHGSEQSGDPQTESDDVVIEMTGPGESGVEGHGDEEPLEALPVNDADGNDGVDQPQEDRIDLEAEPDGETGENATGPEDPDVSSSGEGGDGPNTPSKGGESASGDEEPDLPEITFTTTATAVVDAATADGLLKEIMQGIDNVPVEDRLHLLIDVAETYGKMGISPSSSLREKIITTTAEMLATTSITDELSGEEYNFYTEVQLAQAVAASLPEESRRSFQKAEEILGDNRNEYDPLLSVEWGAELAQGLIASGEFEWAQRVIGDIAVPGLDRELPSLHDIAVNAKALSYASLIHEQRRVGTLEGRDIPDAVITAYGDIVIADTHVDDNLGHAFSGGKQDLLGVLVKEFTRAGNYELAWDCAQQLTDEKQLEVLPMIAKGKAIDGDFKGLNKAFNAMQEIVSEKPLDIPDTEVKEKVDDFTRKVTEGYVESGQYEHAMQNIREGFISDADGIEILFSHSQTEIPPEILDEAYSIIEAAHPVNRANMIVLAAISLEKKPGIEEVKARMIELANSCARSLKRPDRRIQIYRDVREQALLDLAGVEVNLAADKSKELFYAKIPKHTATMHPLNRKRLYIFQQNLGDGDGSVATLNTLPPETWLENNLPALTRDETTLSYMVGRVAAADIPPQVKIDTLEAIALGQIDKGYEVSGSLRALKEVLKVDPDQKRKYEGMAVVAAFHAKSALSPDRIKELDKKTRAALIATGVPGITEALDQLSVTNEDGQDTERDD